eukprot:TRINITY_DN11869_c4_g2_i4.p1 TRINITY_DN11869_c4_g2~~TRINITY_DN11869_c4_g2_i4.p1  ORF type:complete len:103 (+),score=22.60 TRINITY_DN11869_c4_g2_i4:83-391(+)
MHIAQWCREAIGKSRAEEMALLNEVQRLTDYFHRLQQQLHSILVADSSGPELQLRDNLLLESSKLVDLSKGFKERRHEVKHQWNALRKEDQRQHHRSVSTSD